jgi:hypothetical protein
METVQNNLTEVKFHYFSLKFTPLKHLSDEYDSNDIMKNVVTYISKKLIEDREGYLIDRHEDRSTSKRELFMNRAVFLPKERRIRCSMALLRSGREPLIKPNEKFKLVSIQSLGSIAEETHFFIDYSKGFPVVCCEYQYYGPRLSDIEYYFRNVAHKVLKQSKATEVNIFMDISVDKALKNLRNVLNMDIKVQPKNIAQLDPDIQNKYFSGMNNIANTYKPKYIKIETLFQTPGKGITSNELNKEANKMFAEILQRFKGRPFNIDAFDSFVVKYEDKEGNEEIFNLLNSKRELILNVDMKLITKSKDWYSLIEEDFNLFMTTL